MTGTLINTAAIILGGFIGLLLKKGIPQHINDSLIKAEGLVVIILGLNGVLTNMLSADPATGSISDSGSMLLLVSMVLGCLAGEALRIDDRLGALGGAIEKKLGAANFAKGFITATLIFSIGAMSFIGPLNDGLTGDYSILLVKSTLDFTTAILLASSLGSGVVFAAVPVLLLQGTVALLARWLAPLVTDQLLAMFCMVGNLIIMAIGLNFIIESKIKTANLLPALLFPVAYYFLFVAQGIV